MSKQNNDRYVYALNQIAEDARTAYCNGDVDLDDINDVELNDLGRERLERALRNWGKSRGLT